MGFYLLFSKFEHFLAAIFMLNLKITSLKLYALSYPGSLALEDLNLKRYQT